ncbi:MAG: 3-phosphoshikimate 1-carboxyvinyltransferase [Clostridiales bacterium]|nr:3-phosphoshikimate 1-carboxyvinyltransferase [Clostridiales bacterium]
MKEMKFSPSQIHGEVRVPSSKSQAHRALICAALAGDSIVRGVDLSNDINATVSALRAFGAELEYDESALTFTVTRSVGSEFDAGTVNCGESGSTLRFMIPLAAALGISATFIGGGLLPKRTTMLYKPLLEANGAKLEYPDNGDFLPLKVSGKLHAGSYSLRGDISSQFVTGLLISLSLVDGDSDVTLTTRLESKPYADMTVDVLHRFGANIDERDSGYIIHSGKPSPRDFTVEGDCSNAAFFAVAAAINGDVKLSGINNNTLQGDYKLFEIIKSFGANVDIEPDGIRVRSGELHAHDIDAADIPDLVPALSVMAACSDGTTRIYNASRLRLKECDRITATVDLLTSLGAKASETDDGIIIIGQKQLSGGKIRAYNDHRMAMSAVAATAACTGDVVVDDINCTNKSYPGFVKDWSSLL